MRKFLAIQLLLLFLFSCETTIQDEAKLVISTEEFSTVLVVDVVDPYSNRQIEVGDYSGLTNVKLTLSSTQEVIINGETYLHSQLWTDLAYDSKEIFDSESGSFILPLSLNAEDPSETNSYNLTLSITFEGAETDFAPTFRNIDISSTGTFKVSIYGIYLDGDVGNGVTYEEGEGEMNNGATVETQTIEVNDPNPENGGVELTIPGGTGIVTIDGASLSGSTTTSVGFFNNQDDESLSKSNGSLSSIPGGFEGNLNGEMVDLILTGAISLNIVDEFGAVGNQMISKGGKESPAMVMGLPSNTINPNTGLPIQVGESIDIYKLVAGATSWNYVKTETISEEDGVLYVAFTIDNTGYWTAAFAVPQTAKPSIVVNGTFTTQLLDYSFTSPGYHYRFTYNTSSGVQFTIPEDIPANLPLNVTLYEQGSNQGIYSINLSDGVTSASVITLDGGDLNSYETWIFTAVGVCEDSQIKVRPSGVPVYYAKYNDPDNYVEGENLGQKLFAGVTVDGSISINGIDRDNQYYRFYVHYEDVNEYLDMHFTSTTATFIHKTEYILNENTSGTTVNVEVIAPERVCDEF